MTTANMFSIHDYLDETHWPYYIGPLLPNGCFHSRDRNL